LSGGAHINGFKIGLELFLGSATDRRRGWETNVLSEAGEYRDLLVVRHGVLDGLCPGSGEPDAVVRYCVGGPPALLLDLIPLFAQLCNCGISRFAHSLEKLRHDLGSLCDCSVAEHRQLKLQLKAAPPDLLGASVFEALQHGQELGVRRVVVREHRLFLIKLVQSFLVQSGC
jgi:hypothetical protein